MSCSSCASSSNGDVGIPQTTKADPVLTTYASIPPAAPFTQTYGPSVSSPWNASSPYISNSMFTAPSVKGPGLASVYLPYSGYCDFVNPKGSSTEFSHIAAPTDRTRYACPSLAVVPPPADRFYDFLDTPMKLNNLSRIPMVPSADSMTPTPAPAPAPVTNAPKDGNTKSFGNDDAQKYIKGVVEDALAAASTVVKKPIASPGTNANNAVVELGASNSSQPEKFELFYSTLEPTSAPSVSSAPSASFAPSQPQAQLLPIMDYRHNLREIVKNSILLEDHITHPEKRCGDCCTKHFLCLEALAEEAKTLDTKGHMQTDPILCNLPDFYRDCARQWYIIYSNSQSNNADYIPVIQRLRMVRKRYQQDYFPMGWDAATDPPTRCTSSACKNT